MKIEDVVKEVEEFAPKSLAADWDNVGLMIGSGNKECSGVVVALDLTMEVVDKAIKEKCNLILTHHPFFFNKINSIDLDKANGEIIEKVIKNDLSVYSYHTNLDIVEGGISYTLAKLFSGRNLVPHGFGYLFDIDSISLIELAKNVKEELNDPTVIYVGKDNKKIKKVYVVSGSGFDREEYEFAKQNADCFITGDIKYHNLLTAYEDKYPVVSFSHYHSEIIVEDIYLSLLENLEIKIIKATEKCPFKVVEE